MTSTSSKHQTVTVPLGDRAYDIVVGSNLLEKAGEFIKPVLKTNRVAIITDENVANRHLPAFAESLKQQGIDFVTLTLPPGEKTKSITYYEQIMNDLLAEGLHRKDTIIALGGGVIGDLTGFVAATLKRGVNFIQVPTTLLSQVDSSVGGKTAINSPHGKNLIGAVYQPSLVIADVGILDTLPVREIKAGYAEVLKYALLGNFSFFEWLEKNGRNLIEGDIDARIQAVTESVASKANVVAQDENEEGKRALLNLGHTFGHALEAETQYGPDLNHGEGVAVGMLMAMRLSQHLNHLGEQEFTRVKAHYADTKLMAELPEINGVTWDAKTLHSHMYQDKKVDMGKLTFILMKQIGDAFITQEADEASILKTLDEFCV